MTTSPLFKRPLRNGWFSMESAPRTGETIMLYESGRGVFEGWWKQTEYEAYWMDLQDSEPDPVAWRPILPGPHEVVAASPEPPAEEVETLRERVKELEAALAPFSLIGGPLNAVTEGVFPDDASARFLNLGELKAKHFRVAATALDRARAKGGG